MSKESISHRYDIEYTHPTILEKTTKRSWTGRVFIIIAIFTVLFLISIFYKNGRISEYLQELVTSYTRDDKKDEYNNFNMSNHALPIATTKIEVEEKQNTDEVTDRDNFQGDFLNTITVKKSDPSQIFNSSLKVTPIEEASSSSMKNNSSTKLVVKKVTPKPSLNNTSNLHPTTEAPATETPSTIVSSNNSDSKITPVKKASSSSIKNNSNTKLVAKKVIPKPSLKNTSNLHPTTEAPATETPSIKVSSKNSGSKISPVKKASSSSIKNNSNAKLVAKKVIPKPSLKNTSNLHPSTEAPATKTPSTKVSNATTPSFNITNNNTAINTKKDLEIQQDEKKTRMESLTKLDDLLKQLSTKSKESEDQLENKQSNNNLSKLLAHSSNNNNDKQYLSALENLNEAKPINKVSKKQETSSTTVANNKSDTIVKDKKEAITQQKIVSKSKMTVAVEVTEEERKELNAANNTISLSMKAQVDAIILTMQANKKPTKTAKLKKKTTADLTTEMLSANIELQNKNDDLINQLSQNIGVSSDASNIRKNNLIAANSENKLNRLTTPRNSNLNYERALNQESIVRSNAVRSIVVKKGETLWSIAKRAYGDGKYYKKILAANPQIRRNKTVRLVIGQIIRVPK